MRQMISRRIIFSAIAFASLLGMAPPHYDAAHKKKDAPAPLTVLTDYHPSIFINFDFIRKIACFDPKKPELGVYLGTAEVIAKGVMVTAAHVVNNPEATICVDVASSAVVRPYGIDEDNDFALLAFSDATEGDIDYLKYSCEDFTLGARYQAIGYAYGKALILNWLTATGTKTPSGFLLINNKTAVGMQILGGDIYEGMSGGPVLNEKGTMVGINSATDHHGVGLSRSLKDTVLCQVRAK